jgi:hypothetical protein
MAADEVRGSVFARRVFYFAGVFGIFVIAPQYLLEGFIGREFPPPITHPEHFYGFVGVGFVWQLMFLLIATDPVRYRPAMPVAVLEKLAFAVPCVVLYLQSRVVLHVLLAGLFDLMLALCFAISYRVTAVRSPVRPG